LLTYFHSRCIFFLTTWPDEFVQALWSWAWLSTVLIEMMRSYVDFYIISLLAGAENQSYGGRVIAVKYGDYTRRIGVDGTADAIKEAIKSAFRLRSKRAFWLEDEDQIIRSLDRDMPPGNYTLHVDEGNLASMQSSSYKACALCLSACWWIVKSVWYPL